MVTTTYWDTSCILALYVPEPLSAEAAALAANENRPLTSSVILEYEMIFALHAKEAKGEIPPQSAARVLAQFREDIRKGRFVLAPLGQDIRDAALEIAHAALHAAPPLFVGTFDGVHIATALQLQSSEIVTADKRMAEAAARCGLKSSPLKATAGRQTK